eukprot:COSAG01_NODE_540_length_15746_cov_291.364299_13_plen_90_part_00
MEAARAWAQAQALWLGLRSGGRVNMPAHGAQLSHVAAASWRPAAVRRRGRRRGGRAAPPPPPMLSMLDMAEYWLQLYRRRGCPDARCLP